MAAAYFVFGLLLGGVIGFAIAALMTIINEDEETADDSPKEEVNKVD
jgi:hypothetical protein